jgi:hypothetical protein
MEATATKNKDRHRVQLRNFFEGEPGSGPRAVRRGGGAGGSAARGGVKGWTRVPFRSYPLAGVAVGGQCCWPVVAGGRNRQVRVIVEPVWQPMSGSRTWACSR